MKKLEYIERIINERESLKKKVINDKVVNINFLNLDKNTAKILKNYIIKSKKGDSNSITEKKLNILRIYVNLAWITISSKYIDIITRVKHGSICILIRFYIQCRILWYVICDQ